VFFGGPLLGSRPSSEKSSVCASGHGLISLQSERRLRQAGMVAEKGLCVARPSSVRSQEQRVGTPEAPSFWVCALAFLKFVPHASLCYRLAIAVPSGEMVGEGAHLVLGQPGVPTVWLEACTFVL